MHHLFSFCSRLEGRIMNARMQCLFSFCSRLDGRIMKWICARGILPLFEIRWENYECNNATFILLLFKIRWENYEMDCLHCLFSCSSCLDDRIMNATFILHLFKIGRENYECNIYSPFVQDWKGEL
jgi:hypothetical protein